MLILVSFWFLKGLVLYFAIGFYDFCYIYQFLETWYYRTSMPKTSFSSIKHVSNKTFYKHVLLKMFI